MIRSLLLNFQKFVLSKKGQALLRLAVIIGVLFSDKLLLYLIPLPERLTLPPSTIVTYQDGSLAHVFLSPDDKWRIPVKLRDIDNRYLKALLRFEDNRFYWHNGVDLAALFRALMRNMQTNRITSGGSTITMQLARILEPRPRTLFSKVIEAFRAAQLEVRYTKKEILSYYLQYLPFGKNVEGIESACYAFFGHNAGSLSPLEIAYLLTVPRNPKAYFPEQENILNSELAVKLVAARCRQLGIFRDADMALFKLEQLPLAMQSFPREAPHTAVWLKTQKPGERKIATCLEKDIQHTAERLLGSYQEHLNALGIYNAAGVIIDVKTSNIVALLGNFNFWDKEHEGQVNGYLAPRSPGSTLKPFVYALAIDRGLVTPEQLVKDIPVSYGSYRPDNYDYLFTGLVSLKDALSYSLNIPFIELSQKLSIDSLIAFFRSAGVTTLNDEPGYYGLSLIVGGMEMNLEELTNLYAMLARNGKYFPPRLLQNPNNGSTSNTQGVMNEKNGRQLLTMGSSYLTREALMIRDRPDFPFHKQMVKLPPRIFWKTGTSQGKRDAWCIGSDGRYALGIWIGNFDATPSSALIGSEAAAPVFFDILSALNPRTPESVLEDWPPSDLISIDVCSYSGHIPGPYCPKLKQVWILKNKIPQTPCPYHQCFFVDLATGHQVPPLAAYGKKTVSKVMLVLPPEVRRWVKDSALVAQEPPPLPDDYQYTMVQERPRILTPAQDSLFYIVPYLTSARQEIPLEATGSSREPELYWFIDGKFFGAKPQAERIWLKPTIGKHTIRVVNNSGLYDEVKIEVLDSILQ